MIEHSRDFRRIKHVTDVCPIEGFGKWRISISHKYHYLIEVKDGKDVGVWCFEPHEEGYLMHVAMSENCRGRDALHSGLNAINWLFTNTGANRIIAVTPANLKHTHVLPRAAGFHFLEVKDDHRCFELTRDDYFANRKVA